MRKGQILVGLVDLDPPRRSLYDEKMKFQPESLLQIPLVRQMLNDPSIQFVSRALDHSWKYKELSKISVSGFNPHSGCIYYARHSAFAAWLKKPEISARELNEDDHLIREVLFAVHDYLHHWSYQVISELVPQLGFGSATITEKNFEDFVFCHLLTEVAATVGLDYWYLAQVQLNEVVSIGTRLVNLTTPFHSSQLSEIRRFNRDFNHYQPNFFNDMTKMYLSGVMSGFTLQDLKRSPILMKWITKELLYGDQQREYTRRWLQHLSSKNLNLSVKKLLAPVNYSEKWKKDLISVFGKILWQKVNENNSHYVIDKNKDFTWNSPLRKSQTDFRFQNINSLSTDDFCNLFKTKAVIIEAWPYQFWQILQRYLLKQFNIKEIEMILKVETNYDLSSLKKILRNKKMIQKNKNEPRDLFVIN